MLLGLPGDGKSASGNTILGSDSFVSNCGFGAVTTKSEPQSAQVEDRDVTVVDTPGFTQKSLTPRALYTEIVKGIKAADPGPHAFVIVVKIGRISEANIKLFQLLPKLFGKDATKYTVILFTHGDELGGQSIEDLIKDEPAITKLLSKCGERYCVFNNNQRANRQQVRTLLDKIDHMVKANKSQHCTAEMFYDVQSLTVKIPIDFEKFLRYFKKMLQELDCFRSGNYHRMNEAL
ncbi:GTPase IMAP family member 7-like [Odontesthes bonariensis]|uniref:GTPase IMAP family member 7-like n=1 Tax=Odontesthes bonariensis TaxID=219752 RepID=UPI003F58D92C